MSRKIAIFAFSGETMCFGHALLNLMDMRDRGWEAVMVIEGPATGQVAVLADPGKPFADVYQRARDEGGIDCVCHACSSKMGTMEAAKRQGLRLCAEMKGHPSMARYLDNGYEILTL